MSEPKTKDLQKTVRDLSSRVQKQTGWQSKPTRFLCLLAGGIVGLILFGKLLAGLIGFTIALLLVLSWLAIFGVLVFLEIKQGKDPIPTLLIAIGSVVVIGWFPWLIFLLPFVLLALDRGNHGPTVQRGTTLTDAKTLQQHLKQKEEQYLRACQRAKILPAIQIAGIEIPTYLEKLSFFFVGSPGSGKTQSITQVLQSLRGRDDFRVFLLDRNGELLEKLYQEGDVIFNPSDSRSVAWSHSNEPTRAETLAAALIPDTEEPFWGESARALLADLYERTNASYQIWDCLSSFSLEELRAFCRGGLSSRYLENERTGSSVLSTLVNQARFYRSLSQVEGAPFSFTRWGQSEDPRWVFLPLFEEDSELYKPLYSSAFELMLRGLLSHEQRQSKTAIVVDELGALNRLRSLPRLLSESRKFGGTAILGTQTQAQIEKVYGEQDLSILLQGTATKLILNCRDPKTAETFAQVIGQQERRDLVYGSSSSLTGFHMTRGSSTSEQIRETLAVLPSELQNLPPLEGYLKVGDEVSPARVKVEVQNFRTIAPRLVPRQWQQGTTPRNFSLPSTNRNGNGNGKSQQQGLEL